MDLKGIFHPLGDSQVVPRLTIRGRVDLDWEYPGSPERGGTEDDTANLVLLVQEMRAAFGTSYGEKCRS